MVVVVVVVVVELVVSAVAAVSVAAVTEGSGIICMLTQGPAPRWTSLRHPSSSAAWSALLCAPAAPPAATAQAGAADQLSYLVSRQSPETANGRHLFAKVAKRLWQLRCRSPLRQGRECR